MDRHTSASAIFPDVVLPASERDRRSSSHADARFEENSRLADELVGASDERREELVQLLTVLNMDVASSIARGFARRGVSQADLEQTAYLALVRAARSFDPLRGDHFLSYAVVWIRGELRHFFRDEVWMIRPSRPVQARHMDLRSAGGSHVDRGVAIETCYRPMSLDVPTGPSGEMTLGDFVPDAGRDPLDWVEVRATLRRCMATLPPRARVVLYLRYVQDRTQDEIGELLGLSQVHVSRLLHRHLGELRMAMEN